MRVQCALCDDGESIDRYLDGEDTNMDAVADTSASCSQPAESPKQQTDNRLRKCDAC